MLTLDMLVHHLHNLMEFPLKNKTYLIAMGMACGVAS